MRNSVINGIRFAAIAVLGLCTLALQCKETEIPMGGELLEKFKPMIGQPAAHARALGNRAGYEYAVEPHAPKGWSSFTLYADSAINFDASDLSGVFKIAYSQSWRKDKSANLELLTTQWIARYGRPLAVARLPPTGDPRPAPFKSVTMYWAMDKSPQATKDYTAAATGCQEAVLHACLGDRIRANFLTMERDLERSANQLLALHVTANAKDGTVESISVSMYLQQLAKHHKEAQKSAR